VFPTSKCSSGAYREQTVDAAKGRLDSHGEAGKGVHVVGGMRDTE